MFERRSYSLFILVCIIMYLIIFKIINKMPNFVKNIQYKCYAKCESKTCRDITKRLRDKDYWLEPDGATKINPEECALISYELSHILFHVWIGYDYGLCTSAVLSSLFEVYEHYFYNCGSYLDLIWNMLGAFIGLALRFVVDKF